METTAKLIDVHVPREPEALVLVLHGGGSREGGVAVSPTQLSVLRMIPIARRAAREARRRLAVFRLLNSAALLSAGRPHVRSVVGLAPWVLPDDRSDASGSKILIVHGTNDRIASPDRSSSFARRLRRTADSLAFVEVEGGKHAMLAKSGTFTSLAASFTGAEPWRV